MSETVEKPVAELDVSEEVAALRRLAGEIRRVLGRIARKVIVDAPATPRFLPVTLTLDLPKILELAAGQPATHLGDGKLPRLRRAHAGGLRFGANAGGVDQTIDPSTGCKPPGRGAAELPPRGAAETCRCSRGPGIGVRGYSHFRTAAAPFRASGK